MYRNIMVPVDGSPFAREALLQGVRISERCGATLHIVRVGTPAALISSPEAPSLGIEAIRDLHARELADLYQIANECRGSSRAAVVVSLLDGPTCDALEGYIARKRIDLVVMRSHARRGLARVWFGSVADTLIRRSGVPVLVVRPPSLATALQSGLCYQRILVPLDGSSLAEKSLHAAISMARLDSASVHLLRVVPSERGGDMQLQSPLGPASHAAVTRAQGYLSLLVSTLSEPGVTIIPRVVVADDIVDAVLHASQSHEIDLIAIATHGRGAVGRATAGSVADRLMRESAISTMVLHPLRHVSDREPAPVWEAEPILAT